MRTINLALKRFFDIVCSGVGLIVVSPLSAVFFAPPASDESDLICTDSSLLKSEEKSFPVFEAVADTLICVVLTATNAVFGADRSAALIAIADINQSSFHRVFQNSTKDISDNIFKSVTSFYELFDYLSRFFNDSFQDSLKSSDTTRHPYHAWSERFARQTEHPSYP